jgi:hypothetical protein
VRSNPAYDDVFLAVGFVPGADEDGRGVTGDSHDATCGGTKIVARVCDSMVSEAFTCGYLDFVAATM